jgi:hypothetical protein
MVAETFFDAPTAAVLAYAQNFPDGLCAGPLAAAMDAPLLLTSINKEARAIAYATALEIGDGYVEYRTADGTTRRLDCDDVVALGGMESLSGEAMALFGAAADTYMIGDCQQVGNLHACNRGAFAVVNNL